MKFYDKELHELSCTDGGCIVQSNPGMHTNGGCRCLADIKDIEKRMRISRVLRRYREIVSVLANAKLIQGDQ